MSLLIACVWAGPAFAGTAEEVNFLPSRDALNRAEASLSNSGKWAALAWDTSASSHNTGQDTASGWGPYDAFSTVNGTYWAPATFNDASGDAASITMNTSPGNLERYVSLWLDMPSPASAKTGYQLRWTMTSVTSNTYSVTLSKWSAGTQTVLASNASVTIAPGATLAISDSGATVGAWQSSGGAFTSLLSAADSTLSSGYAGIEGSGNLSRSTNFKAGLLVGPAIGASSVLDNLERTEVPFASGGKWSKTSWAEAIGGAWGSPYRGYGGSGLSGAYWNPSSFSDGGETVLSAATVGTGSPYSGEYLGLWLGMPNPGAERSGYEARFTGTNGTATAYTVELSKWVAGTRTVLASSGGFSLSVGTTIALTETAGGTLVLWSGSGASMTPVLTAADGTYTAGYAGLEVKGGAGTLYNFRAGQLFNQPPDTTITAGPKGGVLPNVAFSFSSNKTGTSFECSLDGVAYAACTSPASYSGLSEGAHSFKVRAIGSGGKDETPAERSFQVIAPAKATSRVAVLDNLERSEHPFPAGSKWTKTSWAAEIGGAWMEGFRGYGSNSGLSGAYWNPATFSDNGESQLIAATVGTGATPAGQYLALWLDMPNPASERTGYEARFTGTNGTATAYTVELSKWVAGTRTTLGSSSGFSLPVGTTIALTETAGGTLTLWSGTSTSLSQVLSAADSTYTSGYAGLEVNGGAGTLYNFRAGRMDLTAPNTTILSGPSGVVQPENVSFTFTATEGATSFECSLDGAAYSACSSPKAYPGLVSGSSHTFKVRAVDTVGNQDETPAERSFQVVVPPSATTSPASSVKSTEAALHASVNPNGAETKYQFEYGTTTSYGTKAPATAAALGSGSTAVEASQAITGLQPGTTYHFRVSATNAAGTSRGEDRTFTTPAAPTATTVAATSVTAKGATLNGTVNPNGAGTTYQFEYGTTTSYGSSIPTTPKAIGAGTSTLSVSETPAGLLEGTTYHYRVVAVNEAGTKYGADQTFATTAVPTATTETATNVEGTRAALHATVNPNGRETTYQFEYGTSTSYGSSEPLTAEAIGNGTESLQAEEIVEELAPNTTYHFRVAAVSDAGTSHGADQVITTGSSSSSEEPEEPWQGAGGGAGTEGAYTSAVKGKKLPEDFFLGIQFGGADDAAERNAVSHYGAKVLRHAVGPNSPGETPAETVKAYEHLFEIYAEKYITILPGIGGGGAYPSTETEREKWRALTEKLVEAFGPGGSFWNSHNVPYEPATWWEVWNEPNRGVNGPNKHKVEPALYGTFLEKESNAISHASGEKAHTLIGGLLSLASNSNVPADGGGTEQVMNPSEFLRDMGHQGAYEAVSLHPYAFKTLNGKVPLNREQAESTAKVVEKNIRSVRDTMQNLNELNKKIWITELGWPVLYGDAAHPAVSEEEQAELIIRTFDMIRSQANDLDVRSIFYYNERDVGGVYVGKWDGGCGLRTLGGLWRPAAVAYEAEAGRPKWPTEPSAYTGSVLPKSRHAKAHGRVGTNDARTFYRFQFVKSSVWEQSQYKNAQSSIEQEAGYEGEPEVSSELSGLEPSTSYHYRLVATNENRESKYGEDQTFKTEPSTETFATVISHNGRPGWVTVEGHVFGEGPLNGDYVNINFKKLENGVFVFNEQQSTHANIENNYYKLDKKSIGEGVWKVVVVFPGFGEDLRSEAPGEHEFTIQAIPTEAFLTLDKYSNGTPGTASVSGNVQHNGVGVSGTVNVNFQKLVGGSWQTMSTAQRTLSNGHYEVLNWGVGVGQWRVRAVFPNQDEYAESESAYHEFSIQPVPTETFLTVDGTANGTPGTASVSGNVLHNGTGVSGYVNVNFEKWNGSSWQTMSTAQRTLSNGHYEVSGWGVGVGQWRVRAVFPEQGDYGQSESSYHEFSIQPVPTEAFLTVDQVVKGKPGNVSVSGNVLHNGAGVSGYVNVNFEKWNGSSWQTMSTAQPGLSNGHYVVSNWGVGAGSWRVRAVFPEQGEYQGSISGYHEFTI